jgi:protein TonB
MILDKRYYAFLSRMRRPEGLPPKIEQDVRRRLGASPSTVYDLSLSGALLLVILGFKFFPRIETKTIAPIPAQEIVNVEDVEVTRQENRPPPPPRPPVVIEAPSDEMLSDIPLLDSEVDLSENTPPPPPKTDESSDEEYFVAVEEMPTLVGGITALMQNVEYPEMARRAGIQGRVTVLAYVNENGDVAKAEVLKGIGVGCDEAALGAIKKAKFIPGKQRGRSVKTRISIPIDFRLTR